MQSAAGLHAAPRRSHAAHAHLAGGDLRLALGSHIAAEDLPVGALASPVARLNDEFGGEYVCQLCAIPIAPTSDLQNTESEQPALTRQLREQQKESMIWYQPRSRQRCGRQHVSVSSAHNLIRAFTTCAVLSSDPAHAMAERILTFFSSSL